MGFYDEKFILKILKKLQTDKPSLEHDHSYASPYQVLTAKTKFAWPTTYLFTQNQSNISNSLDKIIDVESSVDLCEDCNETDYKMPKRFSMQDKLDMAAEMGLIQNLEMRTEDWQTNLLKYTWIQPEISIFERSWNALSNFYDEISIKRRADNKDLLILEKYGETFREIYCDFDWNLVLCKWLHNIFTHFLPISYLGLYVQILNSLAIKIPWLIFNMLTMHNSSQEVKVDNPLNEYITTQLLQTIQHSTKITPSTVLKEFTNSSNPSSFNNDEFHCEMFEKQYLELFLLNNSPLDIHCIMIPSLPNLDIITLNVDENTFNNLNENLLQSQGYFALQRLKVWMEHLLPSQWSFDIINPVDADLIQQKQGTDLNKGNELSSQDSLSFTTTYLNRLKEKLKHVIRPNIKVVSTNTNTKSNNNNVRTILWSWGISSLFAAYACIELKFDGLICLGFPFDFCSTSSNISAQNTQSSEMEKNHAIKSKNFQLSGETTESINIFAGGVKLYGLDRISTPTIFIVNDRNTVSGLNNQYMLETLRGRMKVQNACIVVGLTDKDIMLTESSANDDYVLKGINLTQNEVDAILSRSILSALYDIIICEERNGQNMSNIGSLNHLPYKNASSSITNPNKHLNGVKTENMGVSTNFSGNLALLSTAAGKNAKSLFDIPVNYNKSYFSSNSVVPPKQQNLASAFDSKVLTNSNNNGDYTVVINNNDKSIVTEHTDQQQYTLNSLKFFNYQQQQRKHKEALLLANPSNPSK